MDSLLAARRVLVLGLGRFGGGAGVARFWARQGAEVTVVDDADPETLAEPVAALDGLGIRFVLGRYNPDELGRAQLVVVNPAIPPTHPLLSRARLSGVRLTTEIALAWKLCRGPILAVTGSNGKSTTATLAWEILRRLDPDARLAGNIGGSLLDDVVEAPPSDGGGPMLPGGSRATPTVFELSSFQLHYLEPERPAPFAAAVTNLAPNHLDWHGDPEHYYHAKRNIARFQQPDDYIFLAKQDERLNRWATDGLPGRVFRTATVPYRVPDPGDNALYLDPRRRLVVQENGACRALADLSRLRLPGGHNRANAVQAAALAWAWWRRYGLSASASTPPKAAPEKNADDWAPLTRAIEEAAETFAGLPHRLEWLGDDARGARWVNDSKATTPEASILALEAFDGQPVVLVAGGYDKGADFMAWAKVVQARALAVALVGKAAGRMAAALAAAADCRPAGMMTLAAHDAGNDFDLAVRFAARTCPPGGVVLLSPACASWGMFKHYEERGARFRELMAL